VKALQKLRYPGGFASRKLPPRLEGKKSGLSHKELLESHSIEEGKWGLWLNNGIKNQKKEKKKGPPDVYTRGEDLRPLPKKRERVEEVLPLSTAQG